jgi:hypothetical protein
VIEEYLTRSGEGRAGYKAELVEERRRRESLERRVNELVEENQRSEAAGGGERAEHAIRNELQRLGVGKVDLAFQVVKGDMVPDGGRAAGG